MSDGNEEFNAAINFAIDTGGSDGINFLWYWREGAFDVIARAYPEFTGPLPTYQLESATTSVAE